jgi:hypothetical protein
MVAWPVTTSRRRLHTEKSATCDSNRDNGSHDETRSIPYAACIQSQNHIQLQSVYSYVDISMRLQRKFPQQHLLKINILLSVPAKQKTNYTHKKHMCPQLIVHFWRNTLITTPGILNPKSTKLNQLMTA